MLASWTWGISDGRRTRMSIFAVELGTITRTFSCLDVDQSSQHLNLHTGIRFGVVGSTPASGKAAD